MRRRGRLELIVVLPDGSHLMVPAAWTDLKGTVEPPGAGALASLGDLLAARRVLEPLLERVVLGERDDRASEETESAAASGTGREPGARGGAVGTRRRAAASDSDGAAGGVDRADRRARGGQR
jgi:hypothetical protein